MKKEVRKSRRNKKEAGLNALPDCLSINCFELFWFGLSFSDFRSISLFSRLRTTEVEARELYNRLDQRDLLAVHLFWIGAEKQPSINHDLATFCDVFGNSLAQA